MAKYIFVTGGVVSSVGKGITVASIGRILKSRGITVSLQKLDPYLNVDPGTMSPYQHGEVFVTEDGAETDLDLGHYERFIDVNLNQACSVTTGQIYRAVLARERRGDFLGGTIQVVPHVTNEIKARIHAVARLPVPVEEEYAQAPGQGNGWGPHPNPLPEGEGTKWGPLPGGVGRRGDPSLPDFLTSSLPDVVIVEVGGTVGDIEGQPFLEAIRQMRNDVGRDNVLYVHVTYLPYISATGELKTKPTQHSVQELRRIGIQPDVILCRADQAVTDDIKDKIALHCDVEKRAVISVPTVQTVYEVPLILEEAGLGDLVAERFSLPTPLFNAETAENAEMKNWDGLPAPTPYPNAKTAESAEDRNWDRLPGPIPGLSVEDAGIEGNEMTKTLRPQRSLRLKQGRGGEGLAEWRDMVERIKRPREGLAIALVGKYVQLKDAYLSVVESLRHAALYHGLEAEIHWIAAEELEREGPSTGSGRAEALLKNVKGIVVPGGFGHRGIEGMGVAARYARENGVPYLGLCLGFQVMVIEFARHVLGTRDVNSTEFDEHTAHPVIALMPDQLRVEDRGGTMRLGRYECRLQAGTRAARAYEASAAPPFEGLRIWERHRHRFEVNNEYRDVLEAAGMTWSGLSPDGSLVEMAELRDHPFMLGSQFHPEFRSRPTRPHPLFRDFIAAAKAIKQEGEQFALSESLVSGLESLVPSPTRS